MSEFKIGDKVKIKPQGICDCCDTLGIKAGDVVEIMDTAIWCGGKILVSHYYLPVLVRLSDVEVIIDERNTIHLG